MKKLIVSLVLVNLLVACASQKPKIADTTPPATPSQTTRDTPISKPIASSPTSETPLPAPVSPPAPVSKAPSTGTSSSVDNSKGIPSQRSIYFALDSYSVEEADKSAVQAHGKYLSEHANKKVRLEGHADERGSNEYNLALGQRRADGVKKMLILGGANDSQIEALSYGEEKPQASGHDEASWAKNRRVDISY